MRKKLGKRKYNKETKCYKIDIYGSNLEDNHWIYLCSTDQSKSCKEAKQQYIEKNFSFCFTHNIHTRYDRS